MAAKHPGSNVALAQESKKKVRHEHRVDTMAAAGVAAVNTASTTQTTLTKFVTLNLSESDRALAATALWVAYSAMHVSLIVHPQFADGPTVD
jgi:hypothetical protein